MLVHPTDALYGSDFELANTWMNTYDNSVRFKVSSSVEWISTFEHTRLLLVWGVFVFPVFGIVYF